MGTAEEQYCPASSVAIESPGRLIHGSRQARVAKISTCFARWPTFDVPKSSFAWEWEREDFTRASKISV